MLLMMRADIPPVRLVTMDREPGPAPGTTVMSVETRDHHVMSAERESVISDHHLAREHICMFKLG